MPDRSMCPACMMNIFKLAVNYPDNCSPATQPAFQEYYKDTVFLQNHLPKILHKDKSTNKEKFKVLLEAVREGGLPQKNGWRYSEHPLDKCDVYNGLTDLEKRIFLKVSLCTYDELRQAVTSEMERATLYFLDHLDQKG